MVFKHGEILFRHGKKRKGHLIYHTFYAYIFIHILIIIIGILDIVIILW